MPPQMTIATQAHDVEWQLVAEILVMQMMQLERSRLAAGLPAPSSRLNSNPDHVVYSAMQSLWAARARNPDRRRNSQEVVDFTYGRAREALKVGARAPGLADINLVQVTQPRLRENELDMRAFRDPSHYRRV